MIMSIKTEKQELKRIKDLPIGYEVTRISDNKKFRWLGIEKGCILLGYDGWKQLGIELANFKKQFIYN